MNLANLKNFEFALIFFALKPDTMEFFKLKISNLNPLKFGKKKKKIEPVEIKIFLI